MRCLVRETLIYQTFRLIGKNLPESFRVRDIIYLIYTWILDDIHTHKREQTSPLRNV